MTEFLSVYVTTSDRPEAERIARSVIEERLAACANLLGPIDSIYHWEGRIEHSPEQALLLKTRAELFTALSQRIRQLHSYEQPCIVAWPIVAGDAGYLAWLAAQTKVVGA
ncbi:MAG: divalent-cation tolerance protein CutA [Planctomycetota bacterium]